MKFLRTFFVVVCLLFSSTAVAHTPDQDYSLDVKQLTVEQGLSHNNVIFCFQDSSGFLWFGTGNGFNRYDGYGFKNYRYDELEIAYISSWIDAMAEGPDGHYWLGTNAFGLVRMDRVTGKFVKYRHTPGDPNSICSNRVTAIISSRSPGPGILWVGTDRGLSALVFDGNGSGRPTILNFRHDPANDTTLAGDNVTALLETRCADGRALWVGTRGGLSRLSYGDALPDAQSAEFSNFRSIPGGRDSLGSNNITAIAHTPAPDGQSPLLWVGTDRGLNRLTQDDRGNIRIKQYLHEPSDIHSLSHDYVTAVAEKSETGTGPVLWVGTRGGGLNYFDVLSEKFENYSHAGPGSGSVNAKWIRSLFIDSSGILWIGTQYMGVYKVMWGEEKFRFQWYYHQPEVPGTLSHNIVRCIAEEPGNNGRIIWIGTSAGGLNRLDRDSNQVTYYRHDPQDNSSISSDLIYCLHFDGSGALWAGTDRGLDKMAEDGTFKRFCGGAPGLDTGQGVRSIYRDLSGNLWIGTQGAGLACVDPSGRVLESHRHNPSEPDSLGSNDIYTLYGTMEKGREILWIGTFNIGLIKFDILEGTSGIYSSDPGDPGSISSNFPLCLYSAVHDPGTLWIGTYKGGLNKFDIDGQRFTHFMGKDKLPDHTIYGILEDNEQNLWLSSNNGLLKFDMARQAFRLYDAADGLQGNEFNGGAYYRGQKGDLFFGGTHGLNIFNPDALYKNRRIPPMTLTVSGNFEKVAAIDSVSPASTIELTRKDSVVSFEFAALDFQRPLRNQYAYMLEGVDDDWVYCGNRRVVNYTHLGPGTYLFRVKGSNSDNQWNEEGLSVKLKVIPSVTQTWWFKALAVAAALLFIIFLYRVWSMTRYKQLLEFRVEERTKGFKEATENAQEMALMAKQANEAKSWFLANMSHEIRTPLAGIIGMSSLLLESPHPPEQHQQLSMVNQSANHLLGVLNDILDISKIEAGQLQLNLVEFRVTAMMVEVGGIFRPQAADKDLEFEMRTQPDIPDRVMGDRQRVKQILFNLIGNALKFTSKGKITVDARLAENAPYEKNSGAVGLYFSVTDTGIGVPPENRQNLFKSFSQADNTIAGKYGGTGLGLAICRELVGLMDGEIAYRENPEGGSIFSFTGRFGEPREKSLAEAAVADEVEETGGVSTEITEQRRLISALSLLKNSVRLLLAEDNPINQKLAQSIVKKTKIPMDTVADGAAAIEALKATKYHLVLMDIQMPDMDGYTATEKIRGELGMNDIPIIAMTAHAMKKDRDRSVTVGMNDYISKPFKPNELYRVLLKWLQSF